MGMTREFGYLEVKFDAEAALGRALFPFTPYEDAGGKFVEEDDGTLRIGAGLAALTATGAEALLSLVRAFGRVVKGLDFRKAGACPELRELSIGSNGAGVYGLDNAPTKADLGDLSAACPQAAVEA